MEQGKLARDEFMGHITGITQEFVDRIKNGDIPETAFATVEVPCPKCGGTIQENYRKFQCQKCDLSLWKVVSGREWAPEEIAELIRDGKIGPLTGFRSRMGRPFTATIRFTEEHRLEFDFGQERLDASGVPEKIDLTGKEPVGTCPKCKANVYELDMAYACEKSLGPTKTCDFRSGKVILQRPVEREQMVKLLSTGKTDLLPKFISKKGRPFSAFLVKGPDGKVGFEFAPRAAKKEKSPAVIDLVTTVAKKAKKSVKTAKKTTSRKKSPDRR